jgi:hypothetical protein
LKEGSAAYESTAFCLVQIRELDPFSLGLVDRPVLIASFNLISEVYFSTILLFGNASFFCEF